MNFRFVGIILCLLFSVAFLKAQAFHPTGQISDDCFNCLCEKFLVNCSKTQPAKEYKQNCDVCNPLSANKTHNIKILLEPSHSGSFKHFVVKMIVNSTNADGNGTHIKVFEVKLPVRAEVALDVRGISFPEIVSYNQSQKLIDNKISEADVGPEILHVYEIENKGPTEVEEAEVYILWPTYTLEGKSLLYLMGQPEVHGKAQCKTIDANPLKLQVMQSHNISIPELKQQLLLSEFKDDDIEMGDVIFKRKKREDIVSFLSGNSENNTVSDQAEEAFQEELSCGQSLCTKIHCKILNLKKDEQVIFSIRARLWKETYNEIGEKELMTSSKLLARVIALPNGANTNNLPYKEYVVSTQVNLIGMSGRRWWIVGLSICCSISVMALLLLLAFKLNFFKKKVLQDKEPLKDRNFYRVASEDAAL